jgi:hypothetical protein
METEFLNRRVFIREAAVDVSSSVCVPVWLVRTSFKTVDEMKLPLQCVYAEKG